MIRVNLVPPEVLEKRKLERWWVYAVFAALAVYVVLAGVAGVLVYMRMGKASDLASQQQEAANLQAQAAQFKVFEDRKASLDARKAVIQKAVAGRIGWTGVLTDLSLILPSDAWLNSLTVDEKTVTIAGKAVNSSSDAQSGGFKTIAKLLVRLGYLTEFENVWLTQSAKSTYLDNDVSDLAGTADVSPKAASDASTAPPGTK